jgi:hypothetical protein
MASSPPGDFAGLAGAPPQVTGEAVRETPGRFEVVVLEVGGRDLDPGVALAV